MSNYILPPVLETPVLRDKSAQVIIDHSRYIVWVFPPKCAQTALRIWVGDDNVVSPATFEAARHCLIDLKYRLIMSVRHPVRRFMSAHANKFPAIPLGKLVHMVAKHADPALDIHLQAQTYLLHRLGRENPDLALPVEHLGQYCKALPFVEGEPDIRNTSQWHYHEYHDLPEADRSLLEWRYRDDFALWDRT
jgi:hypothetical protein